MPPLFFWLSVVFVSIGCLGCKKNLWDPAESGKTSETAIVTPPHNPRELGWVHWHRDFDAAVAIAKASHKPLFLLFQEVPGCATCVGFGESVLSHPLVIEAIETAFVPVAIHNNAGGQDRAVLERFGEPPWNNPVVRFMDADGRDLVPRADGVWSTHGIAERMAQALAASGREVPDYLTWAVEETGDSNRATFAMSCYWSGEACLGDIPGVVATRAGWRGGREVVVVDFDETKLSEATLAKHAEDRGCGQYVAGSVRVRDASDGDQKYHLQRSRWRYLPLTPSQASRVNAALSRGQSPERWLSPRQRALSLRIAGVESDALGDLAPPSDVTGLASYETVLRAKLAAR